MQSAGGYRWFTRQLIAISCNECMQHECHAYVGHIRLDREMQSLVGQNRDINPGSDRVPCSRESTKQDLP